MLVYAKLLLTALFWGGTFIAGRFVASDVGPFSAAFARFAVASALLLGVTYSTQGRLPPIKTRHVIPILLLGMTGVFAYNLFFFKGLKLIAAGRASVVVASNPILIALLSALFFKERLNLVRIVGVALSVSGAVLVISKGNPADLFQGNLGLGELFIFGCVLSWVTYSLIGKTLMAELSPLASVTYSSVVGTLALALPAYLEGIGRDFVHYSARNWLAICYLAIFGTVLGFLWYYEGIQRIGPTKAGIFINFVPISGVLLAFFILREPLTLSLLGGLALVSSGVYLTNTASPAPPSFIWSQRMNVS
jgi:drug/metabolite transporter (DMT)-like permease